jgi:hypothetical protein
MNIVVLDGFTMNPGDLSWDPLRAIGPCRIHDRTPPDQVVARAADAEIVLTNKALLPRAVIEQLPRLKYIGVLATGTNIVDLDAARERGIPVTNVPAYSSRSVAQVVFALILELTHHVGHHAQTVRDGRGPLPGLLIRTFVELGALTWALSVWPVAYPPAESRTRRHECIGAQPVGKPPLRSSSSWNLTTFPPDDIISLIAPYAGQRQCRLGWMKPAFLMVRSRATRGRGPLAARNSGAAQRGTGVLCSTTPPQPAGRGVSSPHHAWYLLPGGDGARSR